MTTGPQAITGVILAGGRSRRMRGAFENEAGDKALLEIEGKPMLARVIERLRPQVARLVINTNSDPAQYTPFGCPVVSDAVPDYSGPLAGLHAGLRWSQQNAPEERHILTVSADVPFLPQDLVAKLVDSVRATDAPVALARSAGVWHPVIGLWRVDLITDLENALANGTRTVLAWAQRHGATAVDFPMIAIAAHSVDPFFNANTPEELAEARRILATAEKDRGDAS